MVGKLKGTTGQLGVSPGAVSFEGHKQGDQDAVPLKALDSAFERSPNSSNHARRSMVQEANAPRKAAELAAGPLGGFISIPYTKPRKVLERAARYTVTRRSLMMPPDLLEQLVGIKSRKPTFALEVKFNDLTPEDFDRLKAYYGNPLVTHEPSRSLSDFLPAWAQAIERKRLKAELQPGLLTEDLGAVPDGVRPVSSNCLGTALEAARARQHPLDPTYWAYTVFGSHALTTFKKYFDVVARIPTEAGRGGAPPAVLEILRTLHPGDVVLFLSKSGDDPESHWYRPIHAASFLGAPKLSDGSIPHQGDLFIEKMGTGAEYPVRVAGWNDVLAPGYYQELDIEAYALRARAEVPLPKDPRVALGLTSVEYLGLPAGLTDEVTYIPDFAAQGGTLGGEYAAVTPIPLVASGGRFSLAESIGGQPLFELPPNGRLPPPDEAPRANDDHGRGWDFLGWQLSWAQWELPEIIPARVP